jgi:MFS family permease
MRTPRPHSLRAAFRVVHSATFLFSSSAGLFLLLPVYLQQTGSSPSQIGLVAGVMRASSLLARPVAGRLLDQFGRRGVIGAGAGLGIVAILSLFAFPRVGAPFLAMRVLQGVGSSLIDSGLGALVADLSPPGARAQVFAIYSVWINLAGAVMPGAGEALVHRAGFFPLFGAAALALAGGLVLLRWMPETTWRRIESPEPLQPLRGLVAESGPALLGGLLVGLAYGTLFVFIPVAPIAALPGRVAVFFFAYSAALIGARVAAGIGLPGLGRPEILLPGYAVMAGGLAALLLGDSPVLLVAVGLSCGVSHGVLMPVLYAVMLLGVPRNRRGWGVALLAAAFECGAALSAVGFGLAGERLGYRGIFGLAAAVVALGAAGAYRWGRG